MPSVVDIANRALSHTGTDQSIVSLDEKSKEARICARWYEASRDQLLRAFPWNFAQRRVTLASIANPPTDWAFQYRYPTNCLVLHDVYAEGDWHPGRQGHGRDLPAWQVASTGDGGRVILTVIENAQATYTARVEDPNLLPPDFAQALEFTLAANIAMPMANDVNLADFLATRARAAMEAAMANSLNEAVEPAEAEAPWTLDRIGGA